MLHFVPGREPEIAVNIFIALCYQKTDLDKYFNELNQLNGQQYDRYIIQCTKIGMSKCEYALDCSK